MSQNTEDELILTQEQRDGSTGLRWVDVATRMLDTKFRLPLTQTRFGVDFLLGLIPGLGDVISMSFSGILVATMAKNGASGRLVARMLINVALDAIVGSIPILGNIFDLYYKANSRNLLLMREYYEQGKHHGSVWPVVAGTLIVTLLLTGFTVWIVLITLRYFWQMF